MRISITTRFKRLFDPKVLPSLYCFIVLVVLLIFSIDYSLVQQFVHEDAKAKWSMIFSWEMRGLDMHFDTTLGNRTSRLIKSLTSLAEPQAPEASSLSSTPAVGSSSAIGDTGAMLESDGERLGLAPRRSLEEASVASTGAAQRPQHIRQRSLDSPEPLHMRGVLSTVAESDRTSENSQLFASDVALDSPDHLARWDDTTLPYTLRLRALKSELLFLQCELLILATCLLNLHILVCT